MILVGTSGYSYAEWKGTFYPKDLASKKMLAYYSERFATVEINNTFYRMPNDALIDGWKEGCPAEFVFGVKAPRRITHIARLRSCEELVAAFWQRIERFGDKLGPVLFQLPPFQKQDLELLAAFLRILPAGMRAAFEFRNASWMNDETLAVLAGANAALCVADGEALPPLLSATADFGYLRLRYAEYDDADLARWAAFIVDQRAKWRDTFVYFKHEEKGKGPALAQRLIELLARLG
jgi:uncharacterized protein YecE (DUF72 family)